MQTKLILITATALILSGCVQYQERIYVPDNPSAKHDFDKERFECLEKSSAATPPSAAVATDAWGHRYSYDVNADNRDVLMEACMKAKGWTLKDVPAAPQVSIAQ